MMTHVHMIFWRKHEWLIIVTLLIGFRAESWYGLNIHDKLNITGCMLFPPDVAYTWTDDATTVLKAAILL